MPKPRRRLTLDQTVTYQIMVPGELDASWANWSDDLLIAVKQAGDNNPVTTLTGTFDQAKLHSLLRQLYSLGLPIISVKHIQEDE